MSRWTVVLLLLLVPFTMAPRTSLNPTESELTLTGVLSRTQIKPGGSVTFVVQATNATTGTINDAVVNIVVGWTGKPDELRVLVSPRCTSAIVGEGYVVSCRLGHLDAGERATMKVAVQPSLGGTLTFQAVGVGTLGPLPTNDPLLVEVGRR